MMDHSKDEWRDRARRNRAALSIDHQRVVRGVEHFLRTMAAEGRRGWVVTYAAMTGEPDLSGLMASPFRLALTRTPDRRTGEALDLDLTVHSTDGELERHRFGYDQPVSGAPQVPDNEIAAVLVPGLAFGMDGERLGHGAGYYDRLLARLAPETLRVGVTDGFIVSGLPMDDHDVPMTHLATENGVFVVGANNAA